MSDEKKEERKPDSPEVADVREDLSKYKALDALLNQEGGKILMAALTDDITGDIESIMDLVSAPELELRTAVLRLKTHLGFYRTLKRSKENAKLASEELARLLEEES